MVTLTVEDGTGRSDANAIVSLAFLKTYCGDRGKDISAYSDEQLNEAIVRASRFLVDAFIYDGQKINRRLQTMPFPRYAVTDREGWPVLPNEIPYEYQYACCEVTLVEAATPFAMSPVVTQSDIIRSEAIGPIRVDYALLFTDPSDYRPVLAVVQDLLWPFLSSKGLPNRLSGDAIRV